MNVVEGLKRDVHTHRLLLFRQQGKLCAKKQLEVSEWFGKLESTFFKHPRSPDPDIFRVSNDPKEGCTNVGRSGWHIDGTFLAAPFKIQTMCFWSVSKNGSTLFAPLNEVVKGLTEKEYSLWKRLYFIAIKSRATGCTDFRNSVGMQPKNISQKWTVHPLIYPHPVSGDLTLCFHCGRSFAEGFVVNFNSEKDEAEAWLSEDETTEILRALKEKLESKDLCYKMNWKEGDFAIVDNLAIAHYASPDTQNSPLTNGLRILHRTTVTSEHSPLGIRELMQ